MAGDVAEARPLSAGSGKGQRLQERVVRGRTARGPPIKRERLPDLWLMIETLGALRRRTRSTRSLRARSRRLDLDVWLVHARSGYAAINFSSENTVSRDRI
jgi:hypothetical protein